MTEARKMFHRDLGDVQQELVRISAGVVESIPKCTAVLLEQDLAGAETMIMADDEIDARTIDLEDRCIQILALQAPVAGDLRAIVSSIQIVADVERMGALALHVAKIARRRHPQHALPEEVNGYFSEMGRVAVDLATSARDVLLSRDPAKARQMREDDDAMDDLHRHLFSVMMDREWRHGVAAAVDVTLLGRFYERFADHAVEISRRVIFQVTGQLPAEDETSTA